MTPSSSCLVGAPQGSFGVYELLFGTTRFGYGWYNRTYGLGAVTMELSLYDSHLVSIRVDSHAVVSHVNFRSCFAASRTTRCFQLMDDEVIEEVHVRVSTDRKQIRAVRFRTNVRCSEWFGASTGDIRQIVAPKDSVIFMIHGESSRTVTNIGAYFVPRSLCASPLPSTCKFLGDSKPIGRDVENDAMRFSVAVGILRAVVFDFGSRLKAIMPLSSTAFMRYLALPDTTLAVFNGTHVVSVQLETTRRTSEWFGPAPDKDAWIVAHSIADTPSATCIGGFCGAQDGTGIRSLTVMYYKETK